MRAIVDAKTCVGCGLCADTCPAVFEMKNDLAAVIIDEVPEDAEVSCKEASDSCPVEAIVLEE